MIIEIRQVLSSELSPLSDLHKQFKCSHSEVLLCYHEIWELIRRIKYEKPSMSMYQFVWISLCGPFT